MQQRVRNNGILCLTERGRITVKRLGGKPLTRLELQSLQLVEWERWRGSCEEIFFKTYNAWHFCGFPSPGADIANPFLNGVSTPLSSGVHPSPSSTSLFLAPLFMHPGLNPYGIDKEKNCLGIAHCSTRMLAEVD